MKSNNGITLTSLIIYITALIIIVTLLGTFSNYFLKNVNEITLSNSSQEQFTRFLAYITKDTNADNIEFIKTNDTSGNYIIIYLENNKQHQYIYENGNIYYLKLEEDSIIKKINLCNNVSTLSEGIFDYSDNILNYSFSINSNEYSGSLNINLK